MATRQSGVGCLFLRSLPALRAWGQFHIRPRELRGGFDPAALQTGAAGARALGGGQQGGCWRSRGERGLEGGADWRGGGDRCWSGQIPGPLTQAKLPPSSLLPFLPHPYVLLTACPHLVTRSCLSVESILLSSVLLTTAFI